MGCDIHGVFQVKIGTYWRDVESCYMFERCYATFGALAGVRTDDLPLFSEPRGLPEDFYTEREYHDEGNNRRTWMGDHSFSWASKEELSAFHAKHAKELVETDIGIIIYAMRKVREDVRRASGKYGQMIYPSSKDVRFVFGFDS